MTYLSTCIVRIDGAGKPVWYHDPKAVASTEEAQQAVLEYARTEDPGAERDPAWKNAFVVRSLNKRYFLFTSNTNFAKVYERGGFIDKSKWNE